MPVAGVSWYEAAAYAEYAGNQLPTIYHWYRAAEPRITPYIALASNFGGKGAAKVGAHQGMGPFGTYDMAGNVKEWCWNETDDGKRFILGGGWNEPIYTFTNPEARSPFDRSAANGFRCARYASPPSEAVLSPRRREFRDYTKEKPVSDDAFRVVRSMYAAERGELQAKVESVDDSSMYWRKEKVSYRAAYGRERIPAYFFVPKNFSPPFQAVVYVPTASALNMTSSENPEGMQRLDFVIRSGRVVLYPVYQGTYERRVRGASDASRTPRQVGIQQFQDLACSIDYLESRPEIDRGKIAYCGGSMGARLGSIVLALEDRFKAGVLIDGGFHLTSKPIEIDEFSFAPRVKVPVLMLNGRYDFTFPLETSQKAMFRALGTPPQHKRHVVLETAHNVMPLRHEVIREVLNWLDRYLGPVR